MKRSVEHSDVALMLNVDFLEVADEGQVNFVDEGDVDFLDEANVDFLDEGHVDFIDEGHVDFLEISGIHVMAQGQPNSFLTMALLCP
jgi:hypothetical protein